MFVNYVVYGSRLSYSESDISSVTHVLGYNIVRFGSVLLTLLKMKNKGLANLVYFFKGDCLQVLGVRNNLPQVFTAGKVVTQW